MITRRDILKAGMLLPLPLAATPRLRAAKVNELAEERLTEFLRKVRQRFRDDEIGKLTITVGQGKGSSTPFLVATPAFTGGFFPAVTECDGLCLNDAALNAAVAHQKLQAARVIIPTVTRADFSLAEAVHRNRQTIGSVAFGDVFTVVASHFGPAEGWVFSALDLQARHVINVPRFPLTYYVGRDTQALRVGEILKEGWGARYVNLRP